VWTTHSPPPTDRRHHNANRPFVAQIGSMPIVPLPLLSSGIRFQQDSARTQELLRTKYLFHQGGRMDVKFVRLNRYNYHNSVECNMLQAFHQLHSKPGNIPELTTALQ